MERAEKHQIHIQHIQPGKPQQNAHVNGLIVPSDTNGYLSITGTALMKFKSLQHTGYINTIINVQIWHWAALPRNSDWPWLLNESYF